MLLLIFSLFFLKDIQWILEFFISEKKSTHLLVCIELRFARYMISNLLIYISTILTFLELLNTVF